MSLEFDGGAFYIFIGRTLFSYLTTGSERLGDHASGKRGKSGIQSGP